MCAFLFFNFVCFISLSTIWFDHCICMTNDRQTSTKHHSIELNDRIYCIFWCRIRKCMWRGTWTKCVLFLLFLFFVFYSDICLLWQHEETNFNLPMKRRYNQIFKTAVNELFPFIITILFRPTMTSNDGKASSHDFWLLAVNE